MLKVIGPLTEELVFRLAFKDLITNKVLYVVLSAIVFAFIHDWVYFSAGIVVYFAAGVVFSLLYLKWDKIHYNIFGHYFVNIITFIIQLVM